MIVSLRSIQNIQSYLQDKPLIIYGLEIFPRDYPLLHINSFEGYSIQYKTDKMVNDHSNSCKKVAI